MPYHLATPQYPLLSFQWKNKGLGSAPNPLFCLGWVKGLEPSTPGTTIRCSNQLSYTHQILDKAETKEMARQKGFEPLAYCLEGSCSIQLSYWRIFGAGDGNRTRIPSLEGWCPGHCATPAHRGLPFICPETSERPPDCPPAGTRLLTPPQQIVSVRIIA